jgi:hypothetical protein
MRLHLSAALLALASALPHPAAAQILAPPRLVVRAAERPVTVAALDVRVVIQGLAAVTTETITFHNPNGRVLEGALEFPLPDGAAVTGFALDVDGRLADGVVVPKDEARVVLEAEIRRGVDPGLVEQVRGNVHRTRIYPIPARGTRTVQLRWFSPLAIAGTRERPEAAYRLPLPYRERLPDVALRVEVIRPPLPPDVSGGFGDLTLARQADRWVAEERLANAPVDRDLLVRLPLPPTRRVDVEVTEGGEAFFSVLEPAPTPSVDDRIRPAGPRRIAIAWDASASRTPAATERELAFLRQLHAEWSETAVDLVVFRDRPERPVAFAAGDWAKLEAALRAAPADGGTALAALDLRRAALPHPDDALWLLMSDGLATLGESLPATDDVPVHAVTGATEADRALLRHLARTSGGAFVEVAARPARQAFATVRDAGYRVAPATGSPAGALAELHVAETDGWVRVTGRLLAPEARLTLAHRSLQGEQRREIAIRRVDATRAGDRPGPVAISWAQARAEVLGLFPERNAGALLALGRRFGVVTPATSLLVLETLEQHLRYGVAPAASRPELRAQYLARAAAEQKLRRDADRAALEQVVTAWKARVTWWETRHEVPAGWRWRDLPAKALRRTRDGAIAREDAGPIALAAPAPAAEAAAPARAHGNGHALADRKAESADEVGAQASIAVQPWDPQVPYLAELKAAAPGQAYPIYLAARARHAGPGFYLDCAGFFLRAGDRALGVRVLSNLAELRLDDAGLLRVMAWRLAQAGELDLAADALEKVLRLRPEEPQSRRDLALVLSDRADAQGRPADAARAAALLWEVGRRRWERAPDLELVALMELNRVLARAGRRGWADVAAAPAVDPRVKKLLELDLRVSLSWDVDLTDVDLHVREPTGEEAYYGHRQTRLGGLVSQDVTQGYGPEEYLVHRAPPGAYDVRVHYFGSGQQTLMGPATLVATVFTNWGRPDERREVLTLRLDAPRDLERIGVVRIGRGTAD